jgi:AAA+ ATPase superfamily predicted ATPase
MKILFFISATLFILWLMWKISRMERKDWKEYFPYYKRIIDQAGEEAYQILEEKNTFKGYGYCHRYWGLQK